jgi:phosphomannomutase
MSKEGTEWRFYTGNEIMVLATGFLLEELKSKNKLKATNLIIKTAVTTNFLTVLAKEYNVQIEPDLLVGIKFVAEIMNRLEKEGRIEDFLIGGEESHGSTCGNYIRDKDTSAPAILLCELASHEKLKGRTIGQYLDSLYEKFGYYRNYLTEIRLPGAEGMSLMALIQSELRKNPPEKFGDFKVVEIKDYWQGSPFVSETDRVARNVILLRFKTPELFRSIQVTIRPSGTEPKTKMYFEIGLLPQKNPNLIEEKERVEALLNELEKAVMRYCYKIIGIDFPDRGFLLFWQLAATEKMHYFEIEDEIAGLSNEADKNIRSQKLAKLLEFLGSNPVEKVDKAFKAKYNMGINEYLKL